MENTAQLVHNGKCWILFMQPHGESGDSEIQLAITDTQADLLKECGVPVFGG